MKKMGLVMVVVVMVLLGLCACAKRQSKLDKMTADLNKLVQRISLSTGTISLADAAKVETITSSTSEIDKYVSYGDTRVDEWGKVNVHTETTTGTLKNDSYGSYGDSYGGGVSKPIKSVLPALNAKPKPVATSSSIDTKPVLVSSTGVVVSTELTTSQKIGRFVKIVLIILVLMGLTVYLLRNKKSV